MPRKPLRQEQVPSCPVDARHRRVTAGTQSHLERYKSEARYDSEEVTRKINRTPMSANRYQYAVEMLTDRVRSVAT